MKKNKKHNLDTIAAISTAIGNGGIGIVRLSGENAFKIADAVFFSEKVKNISDVPSHSLRYGHIKDVRTGRIIDEVLVTVMRAPMTYTSEDTVEINCHGGIVSVKKILELCLDSGARLAEPGEFTKRAFLNGRIDLSQAEAVIDIIEARSESAQKLAMDNLEGGLSLGIKHMRESVLDILSLLEVSIDFSDEDISFAAPDKIISQINGIKKSLKSMLATFSKGMIMRKGVDLVICGKTNVGKSSLMNALLRKDRVIVTSESGTTRDIVEESIHIKGIEVRVSDTAGITSTDDIVEKAGIDRSKEKIARSDIALFVIDASRPLDAEDRDIYALLGDRKKIILANKIDLSRSFSLEEAFEIFECDYIVEVSALNGTGIENIEELIAEKVLGGELTHMSDGPVVSNLRHKLILEKALETAERALKTSFENFNGELLASDMNDIVNDLGLITGETVESDILDRIFSQFCIGK